jgi:hypothetical protein
LSVWVPLPFKNWNSAPFSHVTIVLTRPPSSPVGWRSRTKFGSLH